VRWSYRRKTDRRELAHDVSETRRNDHVLDAQFLVTDRANYARGETVQFLAILGCEPKRETCANYFVTAAALSPSGQRAHRLVLRPAPAELKRKIETVRACIPFFREAPGEFTETKYVSGFTIKPRGRAAFVPAGDALALVIPASGVAVEFFQPGVAVEATVFGGGAPVTMIARDGAKEVGRAETQRDTDVLRLEAGRITSVEFTGGNKDAHVTLICVEQKVPRSCLYVGALRLSDDEEVGVWLTYVFAQTCNDVALGTAPTQAARTIGGLPLTNNFQGVGESYNITYGHSCLIDIVPNGAFRVVQGG